MSKKAGGSWFRRNKQVAPASFRAEESRPPVRQAFPAPQFSEAIYEAVGSGVGGYIEIADGYAPPISAMRVPSLIAANPPPSIPSTPRPNRRSISSPPSQEQYAGLSRSEQVQYEATSVSGSAYDRLSNAPNALYSQVSRRALPSGCVEPSVPEVIYEAPSRDAAPQSDAMYQSLSEVAGIFSPPREVQILPSSQTELPFSVTIAYEEEEEQYLNSLPPIADANAAHSFSQPPLVDLPEAQDLSLSIPTDLVDFGGEQSAPANHRFRDVVTSIIASQRIEKRQQEARSGDGPPQNLMDVAKDALVVHHRVREAAVTGNFLNDGDQQQSVQAIKIPVVDNEDDPTPSFFIPETLRKMPVPVSVADRARLFSGPNVSDENIAASISAQKRLQGSATAFAGQAGSNPPVMRKALTTLASGASKQINQRVTFAPDVGNGEEDQEVSAPPQFTRDRASAMTASQGASLLAAFLPSRATTSVPQAPKSVVGGHTHAKQDILSQFQRGELNRLKRVQEAGAVDIRKAMKNKYFVASAYTVEGLQRVLARFNYGGAGNIDGAIAGVEVVMRRIKSPDESEKLKEVQSLLHTLGSLIDGKEGNKISIYNFVYGDRSKYKQYIKLGEIPLSLLTGNPEESGTLGERFPLVAEYPANEDGLMRLTADCVAILLVLDNQNNHAKYREFLEQVIDSDGRRVQERKAKREDDLLEYLNRALSQTLKKRASAASLPVSLPAFSTIAEEDDAPPPPSIIPPPPSVSQKDQGNLVPVGLGESLAVSHNVPPPPPPPPPSIKGSEQGSQAVLDASGAAPVNAKPVAGVWWREMVRAIEKNSPGRPPKANLPGKAAADSTFMELQDLVLGQEVNYLFSIGEYALVSDRDEVPAERRNYAEYNISVLQESAVASQKRPDPVNPKSVSLVRDTEIAKRQNKQIDQRLDFIDRVGHDTAKIVKIAGVLERKEISGGIDEEEEKKLLSIFDHLLVILPVIGGEYQDMLEYFNEVSQKREALATKLGPKYQAPTPLKALLPSLFPEISPDFGVAAPPSLEVSQSAIAAPVAPVNTAFSRTQIRLRSDFARDDESLSSPLGSVESIYDEIQTLASKSPRPPRRIVSATPSIQGNSLAPDNIEMSRIDVDQQSSPISAPIAETDIGNPSRGLSVAISTASLPAASRFVEDKIRPAPLVNASNAPKLQEGGDWFEDLGSTPAEDRGGEGKKKKKGLGLLGWFRNKFKRTGASKAAGDEQDSQDNETTVEPSSNHGDGDSNDFPGTETVRSAPAIAETRFKSLPASKSSPAKSETAKGARGNVVAPDDPHDGKRFGKKFSRQATGRRYISDSSTPAFVPNREFSLGPVHNYFSSAGAAPTQNSIPAVNRSSAPVVYEYASSLRAEDPLYDNRSSVMAHDEGEIIPAPPVSAESRGDSRASTDDNTPLLRSKPANGKHKKDEPEVKEKKEKNGFIRRLLFVRKKDAVAPTTRNGDGASALESQPTSAESTPTQDRSRRAEVSAPAGIGRGKDSRRVNAASLFAPTYEEDDLDLSEKPFYYSATPGERGDGYSSEGPLYYMADPSAQPDPRRAPESSPTYDRATSGEGGPLYYSATAREPNYGDASEQPVYDVASLWWEVKYGGFTRNDPFEIKGQVVAFYPLRHGEANDLAFLRRVREEEKVKIDDEELYEVVDQPLEEGSINYLINKFGESYQSTLKVESGEAPLVVDEEDAADLKKLVARCLSYPGSQPGFYEDLCKWAEGQLVAIKAEKERRAAGGVNYDNALALWWAGNLSDLEGYDPHGIVQAIINRFNLPAGGNISDQVAELRARRGALATDFPQEVAEIARIRKVLSSGAKNISEEDAQALMADALVLGGEENFFKRGATSPASDEIARGFYNAVEAELNRRVRLASARAAAGNSAVAPQAPSQNLAPSLSAGVISSPSQAQSVAISAAFSIPAPSQNLAPSLSAGVIISSPSQAQSVAISAAGSLPASNVAPALDWWTPETGRFIKDSELKDPNDQKKKDAVALRKNLGVALANLVDEFDIEQKRKGFPAGQGLFKKEDVRRNNDQRVSVAPGENNPPYPFDRSFLNKVRNQPATTSQADEEKRQKFITFCKEKLEASPAPAPADNSVKAAAKKLLLNLFVAITKDGYDEAMGEYQLANQLESDPSFLARAPDPLIALPPQSLTLSGSAPQRARGASLPPVPSRTSVGSLDVGSSNAGEYAMHRPILWQAKEAEVLNRRDKLGILARIELNHNASGIKGAQDVSQTDADIVSKLLAYKDSIATYDNHHKLLAEALALTGDLIGKGVERLKDMMAECFVHGDAAHAGFYYRAKRTIHNYLGITDDDYDYPFHTAASRTVDGDYEVISSAPRGSGRAAAPNPLSLAPSSPANSQDPSTSASVSAPARDAPPRPNASNIASGIPTLTRNITWFGKEFGRLEVNDPHGILKVVGELENRIFAPNSAFAQQFRFENTGDQNSSLIKPKGLARLKARLEYSFHPANNLSSLDYPQLKDRMTYILLFLRTADGAEAVYNRTKEAADRIKGLPSLPASVPASVNPGTPSLPVSVGVSTAPSLVVSVPASVNIGVPPLPVSAGVSAVPSLGASVPDSANIGVPPLPVSAGVSAVPSLGVSFQVSVNLGGVPPLMPPVSHAASGLPSALASGVALGYVPQAGYQGATFGVGVGNIGPVTPNIVLAPRDVEDAGRGVVVQNGPQLKQIFRTLKKVYDNKEKITPDEVRQCLSQIGIKDAMSPDEGARYLMSLAAQVGSSQTYNAFAGMQQNRRGQVTFKEDDVSKLESHLYAVLDEAVKNVRTTKLVRTPSLSKFRQSQLNPSQQAGVVI
jgi:hypothetical protein